MMDERETVVVIGAGVLGLTAALSIQQHLDHSQSILIVARDFPTSTSVNYASAWAGAHYRPVPGSSVQVLTEAKQARRTYEAFKKIATEEPAAGVKFLEGLEHHEAPPPEYIEAVQRKDSAYAHLDGFRTLTTEELPSGVKWGVRYGTYCLNPPVYCAHLLRKFVLRGGEIREYTLASPMEAFELASNVKTVVNCSGMGFVDTKCFIVRGQTCLVRNPCPVTLTRQTSDGSWSFAIPRPLDGGTIIGGTKEPHDWNPDPVPETRAKLLENASKWFPFTAESQGKFDVIRDVVGRRPLRDGGLRLEAEKVDADGKKTIVHTYGVGGRGYELSWGIAEDVTELMLKGHLL